MKLEMPDAKGIELGANKVNQLGEQANSDQIVEYLQHFKTTKSGEKLKQVFEKFSKEDQKKLYTSWAPTVMKLTLGHSAPGMLYGAVKDMMTYDSGKLKMAGREMAMAYRFLVHLDVLKNPWIPTKEMMQNIPKDAKSIQIFMNVLQVIIMAFAPEAVDLIRSLKKVVKTLSTKAEEIAQKQMSQKMAEEEITQQTQQELTENLQQVHPNVA